MAEPDFSGDPPDYWWSDLDEETLTRELQSMLPTDFKVARAWTEEPQGAAFAELADGRWLRFVGDGNVTSWEEIERPGLFEKYTREQAKALGATLAEIDALPETDVRDER